MVDNMLDTLDMMFQKVVERLKKFIPDECGPSQPQFQFQFPHVVEILIEGEGWSEVKRGWRSYGVVSLREIDFLGGIFLPFLPAALWGKLVMGKIRRDALLAFVSFSKSTVTLYKTA